MKKYVKPELDIELFRLENIMNASNPGETTTPPPAEDDDGTWLPEI